MDNKIFQYEDSYLQEVIELVGEFQDKYLSNYYAEADPNVLMRTILNHASNNPHNAFVAVDDGKCVGLLAGVDINNPISNDKVYQEIFWYCRSGHKGLGMLLVTEVEKVLKGRGYSSIIMSVIESHQAERIKARYKDMGYVPLESHYMKVL